MGNKGDFMNTRNGNDPETNTNQESGGITWEISVPLLNNRLIVGATIKVFGFAAVGVAGLLSLVFATQGNWQLIPKMFMLLMLLGGGLIVLSLVIMAVVFQNRWRFRFTVSHDLIRFETIDKTLRASNRLAVTAGVLMGRPQAVGAGMIGQSRETQEIKWNGNFHAVYKPHARVIILRNRWRRLMIIYCTQENYTEVAEYIRICVELNGTETRGPRRSPLPRYLLTTAMVILATTPAFLLIEPFDVPLWMPMVLLCFALATVWLISIFGYVVLVSILLIVGAVVFDAFDMRESFLYAGIHYPHWSVFSGDDWALLVTAGVGLFLLGWFSFRAVQGRFTSVLETDRSDMGG
jgi:hypothetical protein